jgi:hypothetical protein
MIGSYKNQEILSERDKVIAEKGTLLWSRNHQMTVKNDS